MVKTFCIFCSRPIFQLWAKCGIWKQLLHSEARFVSLDFENFVKRLSNWHTAHVVHIEREVKIWFPCVSLWSKIWWWAVYRPGIVFNHCRCNCFQFVHYLIVVDIQSILFYLLKQYGLCCACACACACATRMKNKWKWLRNGISVSAQNVQFVSNKRSVKFSMQSIFSHH